MVTTNLAQGRREEGPRPKAQDAVLWGGLRSHQGALWSHKCLRVPGYKQRQDSFCAFLEDLPITMHPADQLANPALAGLSPWVRVGASGFTPTCSISWVLAHCTPNPLHTSQQSDKPEQMIHILQMNRDFPA